LGGASRRAPGGGNKVVVVIAVTAPWAGQEDAWIALFFSSSVEKDGIVESWKQRSIQLAL
jgi:hypothetical protein